MSAWRSCGSGWRSASSSSPTSSSRPSSTPSENVRRVRAPGPLLVLVLIGLIAGCGGGSEPSPDNAASRPAETSEAAPTAAQAKQRAGQLLDGWSDKLLIALVAARDRSQAAQAQDKTYDKAD